MNWLDIAEWFLSKGFSIIPLARCEDASNCKRPLIQWDEYQKHPPSIETVRKWVGEFKDRLGGFAIVCGKPSGNLLVLGFEHEDAYKWFIENAPGQVRQLLENSMRVLTGVRSDGKRGVHVYVRLPTGYSIRNTDIVLPIQISAEDPQKKEPLNKVEVRFDGRYVVAPGYRHYSGVDYCVSVGPWDTPSELRCGEFKPLPDEAWYMTDEEAKALIGYINSLNARAATTAPAGVKPVGRLGDRVISDAQIQDVIDLFRKYNAYRPGFRNLIHFYLQGELLKQGFDVNSIRLLSTKLAEAFNDEEARERARLLDYQVKWLLEGRKALTQEEVAYIRRLTGLEPKALKGRSGLIEVLTKAFMEDSMPEQEANAKAISFVSDLLEKLGVKSRKWVRVPLYTSTNFRQWLVNYPGRGIIILSSRYSKSNFKDCVKEKCEKQCSDRDDDKEFRKCVRECTVSPSKEVEEECTYNAHSWAYMHLTYAWIEKAKIYTDRISGTTIYIVRLRKRGGEEVVLKGAPPEVYSDMIMKGMVASTKVFDVGQLNTLVAALTKEKRVFYATVLALDSNDKLRLVRHGPFANSIDLEFAERISLDKVSNTIKELLNWYLDPAKAADAYANGLFQVFSFARKQVGLRNRALLLYGQRNTGKTTIAKVIGESMFRLPHTPFFKPASDLMSPARLGRALQYGMVVLFDEGGRSLVLNPYAGEVFKNAVNDVKVYETAAPGSREIKNIYPAYAGIIITTQNFRSDDPGVVDRVYPMHFSRSEVIPPEKTEKFRRWVDDHSDELYAFGMYYLKTAIEDWGRVRDIALQGDFIKAARDYLSYVLSKLGISVQYPEETTLKLWEESIEESIIGKFRNTVFNAIDRTQFLKDIPGENMDYANIINTALDRNLLAKIGIKTLTDDTNKVRIYSQIIDALKTGTLKDLYDHIVMTFGPEGIKYTRGGSSGKYFIEMTREKFLQILGLEPELKGEASNEGSEGGEEQK